MNEDNPSIPITLPDDVVRRLMNLAATRVRPVHTLDRADLIAFMTKILVDYTQEFAPAPGILYPDLKDPAHPVGAYVLSVLRRAMEQGVERVTFPVEKDSLAQGEADRASVEANALACQWIAVRTNPTYGKIPLHHNGLDYTGHVRFTELPDGMRRAELLIKADGEGV